MIGRILRVTNRSLELIYTFSFPSSNHPNTEKERKEVRTQFFPQSLAKWATTREHLKTLILHHPTDHLTLHHRATPYHNLHLATHQHHRHHPTKAILRHCLLVIQPIHRVLNMNPTKAISTMAILLHLLLPIIIATKSSIIVTMIITPAFLLSSKAGTFFNFIFYFSFEFPPILLIYIVIILFA